MELPGTFFLNDIHVKTFITLDRGQLRNNPNKRRHLSKGTSYIENLDYVMLTIFKIIKNEILRQNVIF